MEPMTMNDLTLRLKFFLETYGEDKFCEAVESVLNQMPIAQEDNLKYQIHLLPKDFEFDIEIPSLKISRKGLKGSRKNRQSRQLLNQH